ncbi:terminase [Clostridium merdae]|uniref:terminase n=1 Tax=Clostridium merdae TaxID=1958780 RepID=UPI000A26BA85|nr:terminase [Clostridium merdae]
MKLSQKYIAFMKHRAKLEVLEGTTYAGKTTVGIVKFMFRVAESHQRAHIMAGNDLGTLEKNVITKDFGLLDVFSGLISYHPSGGKGITMPHLRYCTPAGDKIVYVLGYDNKARWKKALGGQYGCVYIDEANIADMDFVREVSIRYDYMMMTLNPDDPNLPIYREYINRCRPLPEWENGTPKELLKQLDQPTMPRWVHWYFTFDDNLSLTPEKREQLLAGVAPGTKLWKNKIKGLRGRSTGLVFDLQKKNLIKASDLMEQIKDGTVKFQQVSAGVDTSYSQKTADTFAFVFTGITTDRKKITLAAQELSNRGRNTPLAPSDIPPLLIDFLERNRALWGLFARTVYIDSADQATIIECQKYKRQNGCIYDFVPAWKKTQIIDRINLQAGWMAHCDFLLVEDYCQPEIDELNSYSWNEEKDNVPEDGNDHTINADQYSWLPYKHLIGSVKLDG